MPELRRASQKSRQPCRLTTYKITLSKLDQVWFMSFFISSWSSTLSVAHWCSFKPSQVSSALPIPTIFIFSNDLVLFKSSRKTKSSQSLYLPSLRSDQLLSCSVRDWDVFPLDHSQPLIPSLRTSSSGSTCTWLFQSPHFPPELL